MQVLLRLVWLWTWSNKLLEVVLAFSFPFLCHFPCPFSLTSSLPNEICDLVNEYWWITEEISLPLHGVVGEMSEFTPVRSWRFSRSSTRNLVVFKGKNSDFDSTRSVTYFPIEEKKMQLCDLVRSWPVENLWAKYLSEVWLQKVNCMCISIAAGALWANIWAERGALASRTENHTASKYFHYMTGI